MDAAPPLPPRPTLDENNTPQQPTNGEHIPPPPPTTPSSRPLQERPQDPSQDPSQDTPPIRPPPPTRKGGESVSDRVRARVRELVYPLAIAVTSFIVSFGVGVLAANVAAAGIASRLLLYEVFKTYGIVAMGATVANAVITVIDRRLDAVAAKYRPATFDKVVKVLLVGDREGVPAYQQYPFLGMILVPVTTAFCFVLIFAWRIVRNLEVFKPLTTAPVRRASASMACS